MDNAHLFELLNAGPGLAPAKLLFAVLLAKWLIVGVPLGLAWAWFRGALSACPDLLEVLLSALPALVVAQLITWAWPQTRPFAVHLGTQYLEHAPDPGLPSDHLTVFWSLPVSALFTRRFAPWRFPLLAVGLPVGWSRVYLGVHFPDDILAALPVALAGAVAAHGLRHHAAPVFTRLLDYDVRWRSAVGGWLQRFRRS